MSEQLVLALPHRAAHGADDFLVSQCNQEAVKLIDTWPDWPATAHAIVGPAGCGKSHLANVWLHGSGAQPMDSDRLASLEAFDAATPSGVLLEDLDRLAIDERGLFHLLNLAAERGFGILFTGRTRPSAWRVGLADLASRLRSIPVTEIGEPDDDLLRAVLLKQFLDRQLNVEPQVIAYLATRMERSMETARRLVEAIDRAALSKGRKITRQLASQIVTEIDPEQS
jgi:chromosomal replication initiation ATPase DnaA